MSRGLDQETAERLVFAVSWEQLSLKSQLRKCVTR